MTTKPFRLGHHLDCPAADGPNACDCGLEPTIEVQGNFSRTILLTRTQFIARWEEPVPQFYRIAATQEESQAVRAFFERVQAMAGAEFDRLLLQQAARKS